MFDRETLRARYADHVAHLAREYARIAESGGWTAIVLLSGRAAAINPFDDQYHRLSPTPAFLHWVPLFEADAALIAVPGARPRLVRTAVDDFWDAPPTLESDHFLTELDITEVRDPARLFDLVPAGRIAVISRDASAARGEVNPPEVVRAIDLVRTRKTPYELLCLAEATRSSPATRASSRSTSRTSPPPARTTATRPTRTSSPSAATPPPSTTSPTTGPRPAAPTSRCSSTPAPAASATAATSRGPGPAAPPASSASWSPASTSSTRRSSPA
jgi:hypothetical protein